MGWARVEPLGVAALLDADGRVVDGSACCRLGR